jgi:outer membrane protein
MRSLLSRLAAAGLLAFAHLMLAPATPASAQIDMRTEAERAAPQGWTVTIGARVGSQPRFFGSKEQSFAIRPRFSIGRGLGSRWLSMEDDSISIGLVEGDYWRAGIAGQFVWARRESDDRRALGGLGNTRFGGEIGAFAEIYPTAWLRARAELRQGFVAHQGLMADLKLDAFTRLGQGWTIAVGPRVTLAGADYVDTYFGIDAQQAANSGLPQFRARGGVVSYGAAAQVSYKWSERFETVGFLQYSRLAGDAERSPLVRQRGSRDQLTVGVAARWALSVGP